MHINNDHEVRIFDSAYRLGFHAGMLERQRCSLEALQQTESEIAGQHIAVIRDNISLEEYAQLNAEQESA